MKAPKEIQEAFKQLIPIYEKAIEEMPKDNNWRNYLSSKYLGVCIRYAYWEIFKDIFLYNNPFMYPTKNWKPAIDADNYESALVELNKRLNFMKNAIND